MRVFPFAGLVALALAASPPSVPSLDALRLIEIVSLQSPAYHVQGIDTDGARIWTTSVDTANRRGLLNEYSLKGERIRSVEIQDGDRFHPGGFALQGASLWIPVAEYRATSTSVIQKRNKHTLTVEFTFRVQDHIGCLAATSDLLIGCNWDSRDFYVWNHAGKLLRKVANHSGNAYQDVKVDGSYLVASGLLAERSGAIDWLNLKSLALIYRMKAGSTDRGASYTREGMCLFKQRLLLLPEDDPSRVFIYAMKP